MKSKKIEKKLKINKPVKFHKTQPGAIAPESSNFDFFKLSPAACCVISEDGVILKANAVMSALLGFENNAVINQKITSFIIIEDHRNFRQFCKLLCESKEPEKLEVRMKTNRAQIWTLIEAVIDNSISKSHVFLTTIHSINDQKEVEKLLNLTQFAMNNVADSVIWITQENAQVAYANNSACRMLNYSQEELFSLTIFDIDINTIPSEWEYVCDTLKNTGSLHRETNYKTSTGNLIPVEISVTYIEFEERTYNCTFIRDISRRKQWEDELCQSQREFSSLVENATDMIVRFDTKFRHIYCNSAVEYQLGIPASTFLGKTPSESGAPREQAEFIEKSLARAIETGVLQEVEQVYPTSIGVKYFMTRIVPERNEQGMIVSLLAITHDITKRKKAEEALRKSELNYRTLFKTMSQGFYLSQIIFDDKELPCDYRFIDINSTFEDIIGIKKEDIIGCTYNALVPPDPESGWLDCFKRVAATGISENYTFSSKIYNTWFEVYAFRPEEGIFAALVKDISRQKLEEDELRKYREHLVELVSERTAKLEKANTELQHEIRERMKIEQELAEERNMLRTLIDNLPDEIYVKDIKSRFIMANLNVLRSLKQNVLKDIIGKTDFDLLPHELAEKCYNLEQKVLHSPGKMISYDESCADESGDIRWSSITKAPLRNKQNEISGLVGINRDITAFKLAEESLQKSKEAAEAANLAKSTFLSSMSHEIRTPLNSILGFSQLMMHAENLNQEQTEWIETINKSGEHLLSLINDVLEISKIEAGRAVFNPSSFDLHSLINDIEAMNKIKTEAKKLTLLVERSDDLPRMIVADEIKLRQILINILGNAVKFTKEGGIVLRICTIIENNNKLALLAEVEDTGPGIANEDIDKLFQMFRQTDTGIKEGGTGLGLAISRQYAKIMGGDITVKSEPGKGTCFIIKINIEKFIETADKIIRSKRQVVGIEQGQSEYKILVADDKQENRSLLKKMLSNVGFAVIEAADGNDTIIKFQTQSPDIILMDMRMPVIDGYEATRKIKAMDKKKTPIIAVTASAFYEDRVKALEAGANEYLRKPFKEYELFNSIQSCLGVRYIYDKNS